VYWGTTVRGTTRLNLIAGTDAQYTGHHNQRAERAKKIAAEAYKVVAAEHLFPAGEGQFSNHGVRKWVLQLDRGPAHAAAHPAVKKYNEVWLPCAEVMPDWLGNGPDVSPVGIV